jgi:hypothetical protein
LPRSLNQNSIVRFIGTAGGGLYRGLEFAEDAGRTADAWP